MPLMLFNPQAGRVKRIITNQQSVPAMIAFRELNYTTYQVIVTGVSLQTNPKYQATETLGGDVLLVSFGESLGPMSISGMLFEQTCENLVNDGGGVYRLLRWWESQNVTSRTTPIEIIVGGQGILRVFLGAMQISLQDPKDRIWRFNMQLMRIPRKRTADEERFNTPDQVIEDTDTSDGFDFPLPEFLSETFVQVRPTNPAGVRQFTGDFDQAAVLPDGSFSSYFAAEVQPDGFDDPSLGLSNPLS